MKYHVSYDICRRMLRREVMVTTPMISAPTNANAMYESRPVRSMIAAPNPASNPHANTAVTTWMPTSTAIVSPRMRCQMKTRSSPYRCSIANGRAASANPASPANDAEIPESCVRLVAAGRHLW